jgi:hypothetical protein
MITGVQGFNKQVDVVGHQNKTIDLAGIFFFCASYGFKKEMVIAVAEKDCLSIISTADNVIRNMGNCLSRLSCHEAK